MAIVDIIVLLVIGLSCLFGAFRGLVKEALSLAAWVLAVVLAALFSADAAGYFSGMVDNPSLQRVIAFVLIFILAVFVGGIVSNLVSRLTSAVGLGGVDRALGAVFGIIRGGVIVVLVVMLTMRFEFARELYGQSVLVPYALVLAEYFQNLLGLGQDGTATA